MKQFDREVEIGRKIGETIRIVTGGEYLPTSLSTTVDMDHKAMPRRFGSYSLSEGGKDCRH